jgi:hypothetical protein
LVFDSGPQERFPAATALELAGGEGWERPWMKQAGGRSEIGMAKARKLLIFTII